MAGVYTGKPTDVFGQSIRGAQASASLYGQRIRIDTRDPRILEAAQTLPVVRFDYPAGYLTCDATPAAAWRVCEWINSGASNDLRALAELFGRRLTPQAPELFDIEPPQSKTPAWRHQREAFWRADRNKATLLAMDMGTGKTLVAIDLLANWGCRLVLVFCPCSVRAVWSREFDRHCPCPYDLLILDSRKTLAQRTKLADEWVRRPNPDETLRVIVINYEAVRSKVWLDWAGKRSWDCIIADESHRAKAPTTAVSKALWKLGCRSNRRLCLTGTPMPHSPLDVFGQCRFLDSGLFGTSWTAFRHRYARTDNPTIPQQITGYKNLDELQRRFATIAWQCKASDVLDLPPITHEDRSCELSPSAMRIYRDLETEFVAEIQSGVVTAANAMVKFLRLQQITSGFLAADDMPSAEIIDSAKHDTMADLFEDLGPNEPIVVFCRFRHDLALIRNAAEGLGRRYAELSGQRRDALNDRGCMADCQIAGVQIASGGVGIDLTRARYGIYYSQGLSLGEFDQSIARLHRPGQTRPTVFYHLVCEGTVDRRIYAAFAKRREIIQAVLGGYAE